MAKSQLPVSETGNVIGTAVGTLGLIVGTVFVPGLAHFVKRRPCAGFFWLLLILFLYATTWWLLFAPAIALHVLCIYRGVTIPYAEKEERHEKRDR